MTGQTFGRLTPIGPTEKREKNGSIIWRCQCLCGNVTEVSQSDLVSGNNVSCGCWKRDLGKNLYLKRRNVDGTCIEALERRALRSDNKTGHTGVSCSDGKYRASITFKGQRYGLGTFANLKDAVSVREWAKEMLHGRFLEEYYRAQAVSLSGGTIVPALEQLLKSVTAQQG